LSWIEHNSIFFILSMKAYSVLTEFCLYFLVGVRVRKVLRRFFSRFYENFQGRYRKISS
jgi:hypothetical protein